VDELELIDLAEYYSTELGANIVMGVEDGDAWLDCGRTNGREYFESINDLEDRVKRLYQEKLPDYDYTDPLEGLI